jgi:acyl-CoA thioesterase-2
MLDVLDLERLDRDLFRGGSGGDDHLFGGHVMAQALRAAAHTVPEERAAHSMHGYFLRRGDPLRDVVYRVERDRDGGTFSARRVVALQYGEVIFNMSASFQGERTSGEYSVPPAAVAGPEASRPEGWAGGPTDHVEYVSVPPGGPDDPPAVQMWARTKVALGDDPVVHACALAFISDYGVGFEAVDVPGLGKGGASLDHALWFHQPIRADDWVLVDLRPLRASHQRGTYTGTMHDRAGTLGAAFAQEALLRLDWEERVARRTGSA